jgi:hypothetical protein
MMKRLWILVIVTVVTTASATPAVASRNHAVRLPGGMSVVQRVFVVVLENQGAPEALAQPYLRELASRGAYLDNLYAITHPSQPNYIAMTSGSTWGVTDSSIVTLDVRHIGDLLEEKGKSWKVYAEDYPGFCFLGESYHNYVRRHMPFIDYRNVQRSWGRCSRIVNAAEFDQDVTKGELPDFSFYVPNLQNDGHDTGVAFADAWLKQRFNARLSDPLFMSGTLFIVVFDESLLQQPNRIYGAFVGAGIERGVVSRKYYDLYSLLRTIEEIFKTGTLGLNDASAQVIDDIWTK